MEIKEKAFRFDGIFIPSSNDKPIFLIEVQFQPKEDFYWEFLSELYLYLNQYRPTQDWQAVAIFARHNCEPELTKHWQELINLGRIKRVYLEDWQQETDSLGIAIAQLILASEAKAPKLAQTLARRVDQEPDTNLRDQVVEFIEAVLVYKFPRLSRQEIESMFTHSDLKKTRVYQEAMQEGLQLGEQRGLQRQIAMLLRQLTRKFGQLPPRLKNRISKLSVAELENLAEAIFDIEAIADLHAWLQNH